MEQALFVVIGIALAACCGFRVFVPLLVASIAVKSGHMTFASDFLWLGSWTAIITLSVATVLEIVAYYVPWLDNLLDTIATPAAIIAGTLITASFIGSMTPVLRWALAVIAGGGLAGGIQAATVTVRGVSSTTTGGTANPVVSTVETAGSTILSILSIVVPIIGILLIVLIILIIIYLFIKIRRKRLRKVVA